MNGIWTLISAMPVQFSTIIILSYQAKLELIMWVHYNLWKMEINVSYIWKSYVLELHC